MPWSSTMGTHPWFACALTENLEAESDMVSRGGYCPWDLSNFGVNCVRRYSLMLILEMVNIILNVSWMNFFMFFFKYFFLKLFLHNLIRMLDSDELWKSLMNIPFRMCRAAKSNNHSSVVASAMMSQVVCEARMMLVPCSGQNVQSGIATVLQYGSSKKDTKLWA